MFKRLQVEKIRHIDLTKNSLPFILNANGLFFKNKEGEGR